MRSLLVQVLLNATCMLDVDFSDSHAIWALQSSGTFSQFDLRDASKPIASVPRVALTWEVSGSLALVSDRRHRHEVPYDDVYASELSYPLSKLTVKQSSRVKALGREAANTNQITR